MLELLLSLSMQSQPNLMNNSQPNSLEIAQSEPIPTPDDLAKVHYEKGLALHQAEQIGEAVQEYQTAIALDPQFDLPYINLSLILISVDSFDDAEILLQKVLELPDHAEIPASIHALANYNLGIINSRQGNLPEAKKYVAAASAIAPDFEQAQQFLNQLNEQPVTAVL